MNFPPISVKLIVIGCSFLCVRGAYAQRPIGKINPDVLSSGAKAWVFGPQNGTPAASTQRSAIAFGSNVDAANPSEDVAAGQSETSVAAAGSRVLTAWNDATGFLFQPSTLRKASLTGVGFSGNGGRSFVDLRGLPNNNPNQQWFGDPSVVALDGGKYYIVSSLYLPSQTGNRCASGVDAEFEVALSVAAVSSANQVTFTNPIIVAKGGNECVFPFVPTLALLDKPWISFDQSSRTLAVTYTRFFFGFGGQSGAGQIEVKRAHVPGVATSLIASAFGAPSVVWPEESNVVNEGSYVSVAPGGNTYVAWERNSVSNLSNGDPFIYEHAAVLHPGSSVPAIGGPGNPVVVTQGQLNSNGRGGVKSLDAVVIAGYNRGIGNDFPRVAFDAPLNQIVFEWNDASHHPLGDIFLRSFNPNLSSAGAIRKVNDDNSFALHFLPAVSIRSDGSIASSWYDRRLHGPGSTLTDYFAEVRIAPAVQGTDFRISTGSTDWNATSSFITPNFGDYTDNASTGTTSYFNWSDGRIGVPQPFVDHR